MISYLWPMALVVFSNILYNIASKSVPKDCSPFLALIITYCTAMLLSVLGFFCLDSQKSFFTALTKVNWTGIGLGVAMVGLEIGFIFLYRAGWKISTASMVANTLLAVALLLVGFFWFKETISLRQVTGILVSLLGVVILSTAR